MQNQWQEKKNKEEMGNSEKILYNEVIIVISELAPINS